MTNATTKTAGRACKTVNARVLLPAVLLWAGLSACGQEAASAELPELASQDQELSSVNGLSANGLSANGLAANGLSANGLSANGLSANGLSANGLSANGLSSASFSSWFTQNPDTSDMVMRYLVRCAVPAGESRSFTDPQTGQQYSWAGNLGLAPGWASGAAANVNEQKLISACMLAHVNQSGLNIPISVLGRDALGNVIPYTRQELMTYSIHEACFFGNLFTQQGLFFGTDRNRRNSGALLTRACTVEGEDSADSAQKAALACAPMQYAGSCLQHCQVDLQGGPFYRTCTYNGVSYPAITTRMRPQDYGQLIASMGD
jgi:hypothetical protein